MKIGVRPKCDNHLEKVEIDFIENHFVYAEWHFVTATDPFV